METAQKGVLQAKRHPNELLESLLPVISTDLCLDPHNSLNTIIG